MCYKIAVKSHQQILEDRFDAIFKTESPFTPYFHANGFAHPGLPVITMEDPKDIQIFEWGMIPHFAKTPEDAKKLRIGNLNAMGETVFEKPTWRGPILNKRCLVLADGFYESMDVNGAKYPFYIYRQDQQPFAFAGLYNSWKNPAGIWVQSFSVVTTSPNALMARIHNVKKRMPVILPPDKERNWLKTDLLREELNDLMVPLEDGVLTAHPVSKLINQNKKPTNEAWIQEVCEYPEVA
jgi:putative SOS response-associated peptidase YedK